MNRLRTHFLRLLGAVVFGLLPTVLFGQSVIITGKITDASTGEAVPYANVFVKGTTKGIDTDFEGQYKLVLTERPDSLTASSVGFLPRTKCLQPGVNVLNIQLKPDAQELAEFVVRPGENPAWAIMREVVAHKDSNDKRSLTAVEYESYNRIEIDADNLSEKFKKRKLVKKIKAVMDSIQRLQGEDGKPIIPIFLSETVTVLYKRSDPDKTKEKIIKSKVSGIGIEQTSALNQMLGSSFQEYNFYRNWLNIFNKFFVSPIADGWKFYYDYELKDSSFVSYEFCYKIDFRPKRPQDLAFTGSMWITKNGYALKQIDCRTGEKTNINFIDRIKIQQELTRLPEGIWMPAKNRVLIDIAEPTKGTAGMLAKFYTSNRDFLVNRPRPVEFYDAAIETAPDAKQYDDRYWENARHDPLSITEQNIFKMIDTVKKLPVVRSYVEVANIIVNGYKRVGPIDIGPFIYTYANNNVEGNRVRLGFRTNTSFSHRFTYRGYAAYGFLDKRWKFETNAEYLFNRKRWTVLGTRYREDLELLALYDNSVAANNLFNAFARFGRLNNSRPFYIRQGQTYFSSEFSKGYTFSTSIETSHYEFTTPLFPFQYRRPDNQQSAEFNTTELNGELRIAPDETFIENGNSRLSLGAFKWPVVTLRFTKGVNGFAHGAFNYERYQFLVVQNLNLGILGRGRYLIDAGYIPNTLPYPLLRSHLGNQTPFFNGSSFNQMNWFEFVSDRWVHFGYQQYFEGLGFNSIPGVRNWNLRFLASANVLFGSMRSANYNLANSDLPVISIDGKQVQQHYFRTLTPSKPYLEVGYGIENIFRLARIDFVHRLNYLNNDPGLVSGTKGPAWGPRAFGVKLSLQFKI